MRRQRIFIMLSAVSLLLVGCANYDSDINRIDEELDRIENTRIKSLSEQIDRINVSLPELEQTDKDLKDMIKSLEGTAGDLQKAIAENGTKIEAVNADLAKALDELRSTDSKDKEEVMAALTAAKAEIIARLDAMKTEAEKKLEAVNGTIAALQEKDTQLEKKISDLKDYADNVLTEAKEHADKGIAGAKDWASATFSTLESQKAIEEDIASIKGSVEGLKASVADLEKRLTEKFSKDLETAVAGLDSKISEQVTALTAAYTNAISTAKTEIETAYTAAIKSAIENLEASLKDWVNETLTGYSTVAATEAGIAALKDDLEGQLSGQKAYLEGLLTSLSNDMTKNNAELKKLVDANAKAIEANKKAIEESAKKITQLESDLAAAKTEIKTAYEKAISDAVNASEGKLTKEISDRIAEVNKSIDDKVTKVQNAVDALTVKVADLEKSVQAISNDLNTLKNSVKDLEDRLNARIQSISYIPTYTDRVEEVYYTFTNRNINYVKDLALQFEVMPHEAAQKVTVEQVSGQAAYPQTRAGSLTSFEVKSVSGDADGILTVVIDPVKFLNNNHYNSNYGTMGKAAVRVAVSDSKTGGSIASEYISVDPKMYDIYMSYTTTTGNELKRDCYTVTDNDNKKVKTVSSRNSETGEWTMSVPYGPSSGEKAGKIDFRMWYNYYMGDIRVLDNSLEKISFKWVYPYYFLKDATRMFFKCTNLKEADLSGLASDNVTSMEEMFIGCTKLEVVNLWNTHKDNFMENVTKTQKMFRGCSSLNKLTLPRKVKTEKLESMFDMFDGCSSLTALDLSAWNLNNVINMESLFKNCSGLTSVALPKVTSKKIQYMQRMFSGCSSLTSIDLSGWNVENVTEMGDLFYGCSNLKALDLSGWTPKSLTKIDRMFLNCTSLESINLSGWNLENMTEIQYMFSGCTSLKTVDLSNWKTPKLSVLGRLINGCGSLTYANLSGWDVSSLYQIDVYPFSGCVNLVTLDLSGWNLDNTIVDRRLFENCNSLKTVRMVGCSQTTVDKIKKVLPSGATVVTK
ncbi:MAG: BspA family leucine-rich repeat surface protein [Alistipes sp.]|nr:BspA family leucine-rich repeat surface protein [Alistipes sp.]